MSLLRTLCISVIFLGVGACSTMPPLAINEVPTTAPISIPANSQSKPLQLKKIVVKIDRGAVIGTISGGALCIKRDDWVWQGGTKVISDEELTSIFREELKKANYNVVGDPEELFEEGSEWKAELLVAGLVKDVKINSCFPMSGFGNWNSVKGNSYIKVAWQVYSRTTRKVILEISTEGYKITDTPQSGGFKALWEDAFAKAVQNLLANKSFYDVAIESLKPGQDKPLAQIAIKKQKNFTKPITGQMSDVRLASVTILSGKGHGSGIVLTPDGYVITNQHVVQDAKFVKVRLVTGREILGEVVRSDPKMDVALVRIEESGISSIPPLARELNVGDEVYAIGTPLDPRLQTTVTKGIVSGYRTIDKVKLIQSDVNVQPGNSGGALVDGNGNLVGITSSGMTMNGAPLGLNYFIPILDALQAVNVVVGDK